MALCICDLSSAIFSLLWGRQTCLWWQGDDPAAASKFCSLCFSDQISQLHYDKSNLNPLLCLLYLWYFFTYLTSIKYGLGIRIIRDVKLYFVGKRAISFRKIHYPPFFSRCFDLISKNDLIGRARTHLVRRDPNRTRHNLDLHTRKRNPNIFSWNKCISFLKKL